MFNLKTSNLTGLKIGLVGFAVAIFGFLMMLTEIVSFGGVLFMIGWVIAFAGGAVHLWKMFTT